MILRPYQNQAVSELIELIKQNKKSPLLYLQTGLGKTEIAQEIIDKMVSEKCKFLFVVRRRKLVDQTYKRFKKKFKNNPCAVLMAGRQGQWHTKAHIFIASIDTISRRTATPEVNHLIKNISYVFIDEAHDSTSQTYKTFINTFKHKVIIGMTATPFTINKKTHEFWDSVVHPITPLQAMNEGYLCKMDFYSPPSHIVYKDLKVSNTGDYTYKSLYQAVDNKKIYGSFEKYFNLHGMNKKTITFCVNIKHSKKIESLLKEKFNLQNTIRIDSELSNDEQKKQAIKLNRLINQNESFHLITVDMFTTGIDIPALEVGFMLRPTKSTIVWFQQLGRLMRIHPYKSKAVILDFTKNSITLGTPFIFDRRADLKKNIIKQKIEKPTPLRQCKHCFIMYVSNLKECPNCKKTPEKRDAVIKFDETVELIKMKEFDSFKNQIRQDLKPIMSNKEWIILHQKYGDRLFESKLVPKKTENYLKRYKNINILF